MGCSFVIRTYLRQIEADAGPDGSASSAKNWATDKNVIVEIVILAMIAAFLGLRLYSVLGRRAEHEEEPVPTRFDKQPDNGGGAVRVPPQAQQAPDAARQREFSGFTPAVERGLQYIARADRRFNLLAFMEGAKGAYAMILEAFWRGDREELRDLCAPEVFAGFSAAIDEREAAGETLENRLVRIEETALHAVEFDGRVARIAVRFTADIAAVTRDKDGNIVAGSLDDAIESRDIWTFSRDIRAAGPDWMLEETDAA